MKTKFIIIASILILGVSISGCKDKSVYMTGLSVSPTSILLVYGGTPDSQQITATAVPENATGVKFTWASADKTVATVSQTGLVKAVDLGSTQITVMANNRSKTVPVMVINPEEVHFTTDITATDALGRKLPEYEDVGPLKGKYVGLFYWTWHINFHHAPPYNVSEILAQHPDALYDYHHPAWPSDASYFHWGEPLFGYYRNTDNWVLRKHAEMLADAGVDVVFFDCTNGSWTWKEAYMELCKVWMQARANGVKTPQISFLFAFGATTGSREAINEVYRDLYQPGIYKDLFFMWKGKPLLMAYPEGLSEEVRNYFTFRPGQPAYNQGPTRADHWGWLEIAPQHGFVQSGAGYEQVTVGVAQNWSSAAGLTAMNAPNVFGRSYTNKSGHQTAAGAVNHGYNFQEQWERALDINPQFIFITGWNEWIAGRHEQWQGINNAFPDTFSQECSRDIEPMKGGHGDNYYYQMVANIRRFKGMPEPVKPSAKTTIVIDGSFDDWKGVSPQYATHRGSAAHRNSPGWKGLQYTNTTGRNDFVAAKLARDDQYVYFYAETAQAITSSSDPAWMRLFINTDRNHSTGWEGYNFVVNRVAPNGGKAIVEKNTGGWNWEKVGEADFKVAGNKLEMRISRSLLQLPERINMEFKWSDNMQEEGNIMDFYLNGDVAPSGRFNFVYRE
jgi:hypothetical protein